MTRRRRLLGLVGVQAALVFAAPSVHGAPAYVPAEPLRSGTPLIVASQGSRTTTYATPLVVVQPGDDITFVNGDLFVHDVRSVVNGPDDTRWCKPAEADEPRHKVRNPRRFPRGECPLLWTPPISVTSGLVETPVYGTRNLKPGTTVDFYCTVFPNMEGQVIVI